MLDCLHGPGDVVGDDRVGLRAGELPVDEDDVDAGVEERLEIGGRARGGQDDAGDVLGDGELQIPGLLRRILVGVAEEHRVPGFVRAVFDATHEIGEERPRPDVRDDERPDAVVTEPEAACHPVRAVVQLLRRPS